MICRRPTLIIVLHTYQEEGAPNMTDQQLPLFVYGTLRSGEQNYALLRGKTTSEVLAYTYHMELYSLGAYPMMVSGHGTVYGELMTLEPSFYQPVMRLIDRLEGHRDDNSGLYQRQPITVLDACGNLVKAWAYLGNVEGIGLKCERIPNGDWVKYRLERIRRTRFGRYLATQEIASL